MVFKSRDPGIDDAFIIDRFVEIMEGTMRYGKLHEISIVWRWDMR